MLLAFVSSALPPSGDKQFRIREMMRACGIAGSEDIHQKAYGEILAILKKNAETCKQIVSDQRYQFPFILEYLADEEVIREGREGANIAAKRSH